MDQFSDSTKFLIDLSNKASEIMFRHYSSGGGMKSTLKEDLSPVTQADIEINEMVIREVKIHYPEYEVLGEEISTNKEDGRKLFVVDPIDGTYMFTIGCPLFVFSAAIIIDGESIAGIIKNPLAKRTLIAEKGKGAYIVEENKKIAVSTKNTLKESFVNVPWKDIPTAGQLIEQGVAAMQVYSIIEAAALVATGGFDGAIFRFNSAVDIATAKIIIEEAGGKVTDIQGNEQRYDREINGAIISNAQIHNDLVSLCQKSNLTIWKK